MHVMMADVEESVLAAAANSLAPTALRWPPA